MKNRTKAALAGCAGWVVLHVYMAALLWALGVTVTILAMVKFAAVTHSLAAFFACAYVFCEMLSRGDQP